MVCSAPTSIAMHVFRGLPTAESRTPCALAIGNFDGVHRGHQAVIGELKARAQARGLVTCVLTFEPHPKAVFKPDAPPFRLTPWPIKRRLLAELGLDARTAAGEQFGRLPFNFSGSGR